MIKRLVGLTSWYFLPTLVSALIGFIAFPIWTRHFSVKEYGIMHFVDITLIFIAPIARFGLPKSAVRFFSEFQAGKRKTPLVSYYTTLFIGVLALSGIVLILFYLVILILGPNRVGGPQIYELLKLAGILIFLGSGVGVFNAFLRAEQNARFFAGMSITSLIISLPVALILVFILSLGVKGIYLGSIIMQGTLLLFIFFYLLQKKRLVISAFSLTLLIEAIRYGLPLIPAELTNLISNIGDRYVLQIILGSQAVGLYAVAYGLTLHLKSLITLMMVAVMPMYLEIWENHGREKTEKFLSSVFDYYLMLAIPAIILFSFFGDDIMILMASAKYEQARGLFPYLVTPLILHGAITIYTAGLYIHKKTMTVLYLTLGAGVLNILLNILLIPIMGIEGAALATLVSYLCLITVANICSSKYINIQLDYKSISKYILASFLAVLFLGFVNVELFFGIVLKLIIGMLIYSGTILIIDSRKREKLKIALKI